MVCMSEVRHKPQRERVCVEKWCGARGEKHKWLHVGGMKHTTPLLIPHFLSIMGRREEENRWRNLAGKETERMKLETEWRKQEVDVFLLLKTISKLPGLSFSFCCSFSACCSLPLSFCLSHTTARNAQPRMQDRHMLEFWTHTSRIRPHTCAWPEVRAVSFKGTCKGGRGGWKNVWGRSRRAGSGWWRARRPFGVLSFFIRWRRSGLVGGWVVE